MQRGEGRRGSSGRSCHSVSQWLCLASAWQRSSRSDAGLCRGADRHRAADDVEPWAGSQRSFRPPPTGRGRGYLHRRLCRRSATRLPSSAGDDQRPRDHEPGLRSGRTRAGCQGHRPACGSWCSTHRVIAQWLDPAQLFLGAGAMLMSAHDGAVDHRIFVVSLSGEVLEHAFPNAGDGPAAEASLHLDPIPETLRQVTPRDPGPVAVKDSLDKQPIVPRRHTNRPLTARQEVSDPLPLIVTQPVASHRSAPNTPTGSESKFATRWNPQMTTRRSDVSDADAGLVFALATEISELQEQLAEAQELLIETAVDAGELHARIEQL